MIEDVVVDPSQVISDHSLLCWRLPLVFQPPIMSTREVRSWGKLDKEKFRHAVLKSELCDLARRSTEADKFFEIYHSTLRSIADQFASVRMITMRRQNLAPWMNFDCRQLRRHSRMLERRYVRTKSAADCRVWVDHERLRHRVYRQKEHTYWNLRLSDQSASYRKLWQALATIRRVGKGGKPTKDAPSSQDLLNFFNEKVDAVRRSTGGIPPQTTLPPSTGILDGFDLYTCEDIRKMITETSSKSCQLDPVPTTVDK